MDTITPEQLARLSPFDRNRMAIPTEEWQKYIGQWVALSPDGSRILAGDQDGSKLEAKLIELGVDLEEVFFEGVEEPDTTHIWADSFR